MTYFAADIPYHWTKHERGLRPVDPHGGRRPPRLPSRVNAAWEAMGGEAGGFEIVIMQLVNLLEGGVRAQMSKRAGAIVAAGRPDGRHRRGRHALVPAPAQPRDRLDLDLELARRQSQDNPVYYAQYAHARIASILRKAGDERVEAALAADVAASAEELHPSARALVKRLAALPGEVVHAADRRAPAPHDHLHDRGGPGLLGLLPRLQGGRRGRGGRRRGPADRAQRAHPPHDRPLPGPAGRVTRPSKCEPTPAPATQGACRGILSPSDPNAPHTAADRGRAGRFALAPAGASPAPAVLDLRGRRHAAGPDRQGPDKAMAEVKYLGADMVRAFIVWSRVAPTHPSRTIPPGFDPADPNSPGYDWACTTSFVKRARATGSRSCSRCRARSRSGPRGSPSAARTSSAATPTWR